MSTEEAKAKSEKFTDLAKRNTLHHHVGMTGYAAKRPKWRQEEREAAEAGLDNPFEGVDERARDFFYARRPKKLKEGRNKYNEPQTEEAEKALLAIKAAKERGEFQPRRDHDELTEALGNPEHRGRVRGVSSRQSWKNVESWQSDAASYHTRQRYKEEIFQKGKEEAMREIVMGTIQDAFTSTDPKMVELRAQMFRQAGVLPRQGEAVVQGQMVMHTSEFQKNPVNEIVVQTLCTLQVPWGRSGRKKDVAQGMVQPHNPKAMYNGKPIPPDYALVDVAWTHNDYEEDELDFPTEDGVRLIGGTIGSRVLWNKADILLEMPTPASQPSRPSSSPPGGPSDDDDDDNGGEGNNNVGGPDSSPGRTPCPIPSNPSQGGSGGAPGNDTPPPSQGKRQCPPAPKKVVEEEGDKPAELTEMEWAVYRIAQEYQYTTTFQRYMR